jgi:hypothetical protein
MAEKTSKARRRETHTQGRELTCGNKRSGTAR